MTVSTNTTIQKFGVSKIFFSERNYSAMVHLIDQK